MCSWLIRGLIFQLFVVSSDGGWFIQPFQAAFSGPHSIQFRASWESLSTQEVTTLWGAPGSGRKSLADRLLSLGSRITSHPTLTISATKSQTAAEVLRTLEKHGAQPIHRILSLQDLDFSSDESSAIITRALELKWHKILVVAINPSRHLAETPLWIGPLDREEAWSLIESLLFQKGITPVSAHRQLSDRLGGHTLTLLAGAEAMAAMPPSELEARCESTEALLQLSPRIQELESATALTMASLPPELMAPARRMGFLGCPFRPSTRQALIDPMSPSPLTPIVDSSLAVWEAGWLKPLPQLIWHTRRHSSEFQQEEADAWISFVRWCLKFCTEHDHAELVTTDVLNYNRACLAKTWAKSTAWADKAGLAADEKNLLILGAAARCMTAKQLAMADELLNLLTADPAGQEGTLAIFKGWLEGLRGDYEASIDHLHRGIESAMEAGRSSLAAAGLFRLGGAYFDLGKTVTAEFAFRQGAELAKASHSPIYPALLARQAFVISYQGRHEDALALQLKAVKEWEAYPEAPAARAMSKLGYARICFYSGNLDQAEADLLTVLPELLEHDLLEDAALACVFLALVGLTRGKFSSGLSYGRQAEAYAERSGTGLLQIYGYVQQVWALMGLNRDSEADALIDKTASTIIRGKHKVATAVILALLAAQSARRGEHQLALLILGAAEAFWEKSGRSPSLGEQAIVDRFLKASFENVPPAEARSLKQAGSMIPADQIVSQLMIDRERLLHPRVGQTSLSGLHQLSPREREVFELLADAKSNREIADILGVTEGTVKRQIHSLGVKLKMEGRFQLIQASKRMRPLSEEGPQTQYRPT